jgi:hypothetical protein
MEQQWGRIKSNTKTMYKAKPLTESCHFKSPTNPYQEEQITEIDNVELDTHFLNLLLESKYGSF